MLYCVCIYFASSLDLLHWNTECNCYIANMKLINSYNCLVIVFFFHMVASIYAVVYSMCVPFCVLLIFAKCYGRALGTSRTLFCIHSYCCFAYVFITIIIIIMFEFFFFHFCNYGFIYSVHCISFRTENGHSYLIIFANFQNFITL